MKKKYIYMLAPLVGLIIFCVFYIPFANRYDAQQEAKHKKELADRDAKLMAEAEARRQAIIKANEDADRRKREREAKAARDKADQDAREASLAQREKAFNDQKKYKDQVASLQKEIAAEQKAIAAIEQDKQDALKEQSFLKSYVQQAETNAQNILSLVDKLAAAEKARADADAAAKRAAANNS